MRKLPALLLTLVPCAALAATPLSAEREQELRNLLYQDCGSCHGMRLTGGLGPALTPQALVDRPRELLVATIRDGRAGTPMPPWKNLLDEQEIAWLVDTLLETRTAP